jgi:Uma2 family endonuclease
MNPPAGGWTSSGNAQISFQLSSWCSTHERGRTFDSSGGFRLPDGSTLSPDASYVSEDRLKRLPKGALRGFPQVCDWMANGAQLGWLIAPCRQQVFVYHEGPHRNSSQEIKFLG